jgi:hypothetical protein
MTLNYQTIGDTMFSNNNVKDNTCINLYNIVTEMAVKKSL